MNEFMNVIGNRIHFKHGNMENIGNHLLFCPYEHIKILKLAENLSWFTITMSWIVTSFYIVIREPNCIPNKIVAVLFIYMNNTSVQVKGNVFIHNHTSVMKPHTLSLWTTKVSDTMIRLDKLNEIDNWLIKSIMHRVIHCSVFKIPY